MNPQSLGERIARLRNEAPLVLNIANYVVMNNTANALLALGASPIMAHAIDEMDELVALSRALVINIGTLSPPWIEAMFRAGRAARQRGVPVVLDPVGCGASTLRTTTARDLVEAVGPAVIRGNASEIKALLGAAGGTKGVDSVLAPDQVVADAEALARSAGCVVSVSGPVDLIVGDGRVARVANGHPIMTRVTGMGCTSSALTGAFLALGPTAFDAARDAMAVMGVAGELAAERASGPGSFPAEFLDSLHALDSATLAARLRVSEQSA